MIETAVGGFPTGWFAPNYKYLSDAWREGVGLLAPLEPKINVQERRIELPGKGSMEFWSLDLPDAGRSRKYKRVVVDEAGLVQNLEDAWNGAIRPTLTDYKGDAWLCGTPKGRGYFHKLWTRGQADNKEWKSWRMPTVSNPYIDPSEIESARLDTPPSFFNQEYLGIPADDGGNPFDLRAIADCTMAEMPLSIPVCFGVDLAKSQDYTVVCGMDMEGRVCRLERWQSDWGQTLRRVKDICGLAPTLLDSTGVGDPIVEQLQREMNEEGEFGSMEGFKFSQPSKQQLMQGLASSLQKREIRFPEGWLRDELESFEYEYKGSGVSYSAPEGQFDDGVCAFALCNRKRQQLQGWNVKLVGARTIAV